MVLGQFKTYFNHTNGTVFSSVAYPPISISWEVTWFEFTDVIKRASKSKNSIKDSIKHSLLEN